MGADTEHEGFANYAGEGRVRSTDHRGSALMTLRQAREQREALDRAIAEAEEAEARWTAAIASAEAAQ